MQRFVSLDQHNIADYVIGGTLCAGPFVFGMSDVKAARNVHLGLGLGLIGYSLLTKYRWSVAKVIPIGVHMTMDVVAGNVLMAAPWLFGYRKRINATQLALHFIMGLGAGALVALTRPLTERGKLSVARGGEQTLIEEIRATVVPNAA